jgi:hypothetical protein
MSSVNVTVDVEQSACNLTTSTVTYTGNGEHTITPPEGYDGFSEVVVNIDSECDDRYDEGVADQKAKLESTTFNENGSYTREDGWNNVTVDVDTVTPYNNGKKDGADEQKAKLTDIEITENGTYRRSDGYKEVVVNVSCSGDFEDGREAGKAEQKSKIEEITITENGTYTNEDGYSPVIVNVDTVTPYNNGKEDGIEEQKSKLVSGTFTENGTYNRDDGYNQVIVNVDTETPYNEGYDDGYKDGESDQKDKLGTVTITENGTYTSNNGYKTVTVNITCPECPQCPECPDCPECKECPECPECKECENCPDLTVLNWTCDDVEGSWMNDDIAYSQGLLENGVTSFKNDIDLVLSPKVPLGLSAAEKYEGCIHLTYVPPLPGTECTDMTEMFNGCEHLRGVPILYCKMVERITDMFKGCTALKNIRGFTDLGWNITRPSTSLDLSVSDHITYDSIMRVINTIHRSRLSDMMIYLKIKRYLYDQLSAEDIEIATNKHWCIVVVD